MEITVAGIVAVVTMLFAEILKLFGIEGKNIPVINFGIGLISGAVYFLFNQEMSLATAILTCLIASMSAGGTYDLIRSKEEK